MKKFTLALAAVLGLFAGTRADAALRLDFSNVTDAVAQAVGTGNPGSATLSFTNDASGNSFKITGSSGGTGDAVNLLGTITGGFQYLSSGIQSPGGGVQIANLTSVGTTQLQIFDTAANTLTANISGVNVSTFGTGTTINFSGSINLTNAAYSGTNADLTQLMNEVNAGGGIITITFQFTSPTSLTDLLTDTHTASYSGVITTAPVPEPGSLALAFTGVTMLGLGCYRQHRRKQV